MANTPLHIQHLYDNINEVLGLLNIHIKVAGTTRGRKTNVQILNKASVVLLTACWESFIEELLSASFDYLLTNSTSHNTIPMSVLTKASVDLKNSSDNRKVWELAGDGWKSTLNAYKAKILSKEIDFFHVPRPDNIDEIFENLLGITSITSKWKWKKMSNVNAKKTLNNFIDLRGTIAHKVKATKSVTKKDVLYYLHFLNCIGVILHNTVVRFLILQVKKSPWITYRYKTIK